MNIYITKNGQQQGPYTLQQVEGLVQNGQVAANDFAWYEGIPNWIPVTQLPGYAGTVAGAPAMAEASRERPILVWVICGFYFLSVFCGGIMVVLLPFLAQLPNLPEAQKQYFESQTTFDYGVIFLGLGANLVAAILLFLLRRQALYWFIGLFLLGVFNLIYQIVFKHWLEMLQGPGAAFGLIGLVIGWGLNLAIIGYLWHLTRKGVLR